MRQYLCRTGITSGLAEVAQETQALEQEIDAADDYAGVMNALRGDNKTIEERRTELATHVGSKDADATPESVLICFIALVAPAADATLTLNVIVLPLTLVVRPVPPAKVTDAEVLEEVTVPSSPTKLFINGFAP